jgi:hypothetical protein
MMKRSKWSLRSLGIRNKYEYDHDCHVIRLDRRLFSATIYPADYVFWQWAEVQVENLPCLLTARDRAGSRIGLVSELRPPWRTPSVRRREAPLGRMSLCQCGGHLGDGLAPVRASPIAHCRNSLAGFTLDSCIEIFASLVVVGQLRGHADPGRERRALRRIGLAFFTLACYLVAQTIVSVVFDIHPDHSPLGIGWLAATAVAMFWLAAGKARTGAELGNPVLSAQARVTVVDGALATGILAGLVCNALLDWWWSDIAAGVVVIVYGLKEGLHHVREAG